MSARKISKAELFEERLHQSGWDGQPETRDAAIYALGVADGQAKATAERSMLKQELVKAKSDRDKITINEARALVGRANSRVPALERKRELLTFVMQALEAIRRAQPGKRVTTKQVQMHLMRKNGLDLPKGRLDRLRAEMKPLGLW